MSYPIHSITSFLSISRSMKVGWIHMCINLCSLIIFLLLLISIWCCYNTVYSILFPCKVLVLGVLWFIMICIIMVLLTFSPILPCVYFQKYSAVLHEGKFVRCFSLRYFQQWHEDKFLCIGKYWVRFELGDLPTHYSTRDQSYTLPQEGWMMGGKPIPQIQSLTLTRKGPILCMMANRISSYNYFTVETAIEEHPEKGHKTHFIYSNVEESLILHLILSIPLLTSDLACCTLSQ